MTTARRRWVEGFVTLAVASAILGSMLGSIGDASAHVVMGTKSLHLRVAEAELVVRGLVIDPAQPFVAPEGGGSRALVVIKIVEILKGDLGSEPDGPLRLVQGGHDEPIYAPKQEALFFLDPIEKSHELQSFAVPEGPSHISYQEKNELFLLEGPHADTLLRTTRAYAASELAIDVKERIELIRSATLDLLTSGSSELGGAALASLILSPKAALLRPADLPRLEAVVDDRAVSIGYRAGLLAELERRGLVDGRARWIKFLEAAPSADLPNAIRAVAAHLDPKVEAFLIAQLGRTENAAEIQIAAEAAIALGGARSLAAVEALSKALASDNPRVRNAAIRGLARNPRRDARQALSQAAEQHPDPATRRRARAQVESPR